jgi:hypothetical protein
VTACLLPWPAAAQQPSPPQQQRQRPSQWEQLPRLQLERQYAGPLRDTIVQRWRDPADGVICYIYLPISAPHSPPAQQVFVQYGANTIGSISCLAPVAAAASTPPARSSTPTIYPPAPKSP